MVLDGATALAVPTVYGQTLTVRQHAEPGVNWTSLNEKGEIWFESFLDLKHPLEKLRFSVPPQGGNLTPQGKNMSESLEQILEAAKKISPEFLAGSSGCSITTVLDFPRDWGLGSSSTLINNIAQWAKVDPYELLQKTFGGSGYDIAVAQKGHPLQYTLTEEKPEVIPVSLNWGFKDQLFFVHLNRKQDSREGIARYRASQKDKTTAIEEISKISIALPQCTSQDEFIKLLNHHEEIISSIIGMPSIKDSLFSDYTGCIKSLGAWGGDFVLVTGAVSDQGYFRKKGYETIIPFSTMVK